VRTLKTEHRVQIFGKSSSSSPMRVGKRSRMHCRPPSTLVPDTSGSSFVRCCSPRSKVVRLSARTLSLLAMTHR
jgi:hypothetical protein